MTGAQASGKTTVGHALAGRLARAVHVDGDAIHRFVISGEVPYDVPPPPGAEQQLWLRYEGALRVAELYARHAFDAIVTDNIYGDHLDALLATAEQLAPGRVHLVVLDTSAEVVAERDRARDKTGYSPSITAQLLVAEVRNLPRSRGLWVDNTGLSVTDTVDWVHERLDQARIPDAH